MTWFSNAGRKSLLFSVNMLTLKTIDLGDMSFVWVAQTDMILVWGIELDLIPVWGEINLVVACVVENDFISVRWIGIGLTLL